MLPSPKLQAVLILRLHQCWLQGNNHSFNCCLNVEYNGSLEHWLRWRHPICTYLHWERITLPSQSISIHSCSKVGLLKRASTAQHSKQHPLGWTTHPFESENGHCSCLLSDGCFGKFIQTHLWDSLAHRQYYSDGQNKISCRGWDCKRVAFFERQKISPEVAETLGIRIIFSFYLLATDEGR